MPLAWIGWSRSRTSAYRNVPATAMAENASPMSRIRTTPSSGELSHRWGNPDGRSATPWPIRPERNLRSNRSDVALAVFPGHPCLRSRQFHATNKVLVIQCSTSHIQHYVKYLKHISLQEMSVSIVPDGTETSRGQGSCGYRQHAAEPWSRLFRITFSNTIQINGTRRKLWPIQQSSQAPLQLRQGDRERRRRLVLMCTLVRHTRSPL